MDVDFNDSIIKEKNQLNKLKNSFDLKSIPKTVSSQSENYHINLKSIQYSSIDQNKGNIFLKISFKSSLENNKKKTMAMKNNNENNKNDLKNKFNKILEKADYITNYIKKII